MARFKMYCYFNSIRSLHLFKACRGMVKPDGNKTKPIQMTYSVYGSDEKQTPLVIMHGLFGSKSNWNSLSKALSSQTGRKVFAVDARNHGESPHTDEFSYYHLVEDMNYFLQNLNIPKACILGHSMGGRVMMLFSHAYPEFVDKLIVVDICHKSPGTQMTGMIKYFKAMKSVNLSKSLSMSEGRIEANNQLASSIPEVDVRQFLLTNLIKDKEFKWRLNLNALEKAFETDIIEFPVINTKFNKPTLFIGGTKSFYLRPEDEGSIKDVFPNAIFEYLEAGHWLHAEKPTDFLKIVTSFLK